MSVARNIKTETTFADEVLHGLRDFRESVERGEAITMRTIKLDLQPRQFSPGNIRALRRKLGVSQAVFAHLLAVSVELVQHWEQGLRKPKGIACRLLEDIQGEPARWLARLAKSDKASHSKPKRKIGAR
jgi:putative transcriptional regulator